MSGQSFRKGVFTALQQCGFARLGNLLRAKGDGVSVFINVEKGFGDQWFVNVGFCIDSVSTTQPTRIEHSHLYFRLERLFPEYRDIIIGAGQLGDPGQQTTYFDFINLLISKIAIDLKLMLSERSLSEAFDLGRLNEGLITKEARGKLTSSN